jgi:hypothetical protein
MRKSTILAKRLLFLALMLGLALPTGRLLGADQADQSWPEEFDDGSIHLVLYQPQVDSWKQDRLEARMAATATRQGQPNEVFGIVTFSARTEVDKETRMVALEDLKVTNVAFPGSGSSQGELTQILRSHIQGVVTISLDRLLADVAVANAEFASESSSILKNDPPKIIFSQSPAALILIDGEPKYQNVEGSKYKRVMNTPALLLYDPATSTYYLDGQTRWMAATNLNGPWSQPAAAPSDLEPVRAQALAEEEKDPHDHSKDPGTAPAGAPPPTVYVSTAPAELIETQGAPQFSPIPKTQLTYVTNTGSDIFVDVKKQTFYVLLSGRWYTAKTMNGPWSWVAGKKLPADFSHIPPDHPKSAVLASVPGTVEAREAVIANQVPQTAVVKRSEAKLTVRYDGAPQFKPIEGMNLEYAINTPTDVIHADGRYYALEDGIWFVCDSPLGPWVVADAIPAAIYSIPPSSPLYHVRYVYIYGQTPDWVEFGYTPGYFGAFVSDDVVVFGTGWWYPGWCGDLYFGWPWTWGFGSEFGYWTGGWFWRPVGGYWWYHNPWNVHRIYNGHRHPNWAQNDPERIRGNANVYSRWPASVVLSRGLRQPPAAVASGQHADLYAGKDGHVYEHRPDGWYQRDNSKPPQKVKATPNLNNQSQARSYGAARQSEFQSRGHSVGMPHVSAPRGIGGGGRMGGGPRR